MILTLKYLVLYIHKAEAILESNSVSDRVVTGVGVLTVMVMIAFMHRMVQETSKEMSNIALGSSVIANTVGVVDPRSPNSS